MCGIAGVMTASGGAVAETILDRLEAALAHRGPDGAGRFHGTGVGLVHRRLAIIDLTTGDQPLHAPGGAVLVANGEIYNYLELKAALPDIAFATRSDCEPPLHLYQREGTGFARSLRGMYAIALFDPATDHLLLARDRFGIKPLYYAETPTGFAFASEPQALIRAGWIGAELNPAARNELLQLQFTTGRDTIFAGIERVLPGETLVVGQGRVVERQRLAALPEAGPADWSEEEALARLETALMESVELHQRADVPYGLFLSGGIDSSVILAAMARLNAEPVRAFTAGFSGTDVHDERAAARHLAKAVGADHVEVDFAERDFWQLLPRIAAALDDPAADYAVLPTWKLGQRAAEAGLKVVLCGEGGDELFAGYGRYRAAIRPWWIGGRAMRAKGILDRPGLLREPLTGWRDGILAAESRAADFGRSRLQAAQAVDCADWLPHDLLLKLDRCLMAHGVEGRTPLLDPAVAEVALRLPDRLKVRDGRGKYLLRRWLARALPQADPFGRKRGFTVPVGHWIAARGEALWPLVARQEGVARICHEEAVRRVFSAGGKHEAFAAWTLLFYALWHQHHILGLAVADDVFAALETRI